MYLETTVLLVFAEITVQPQPINPWDNVKTTAEKGLAKGLAWLENGLQNLNSSKT